jgi:hypothetical protein
MQESQKYLFGRGILCVLVLKRTFQKKQKKQKLEQGRVKRH